MYMSSRKISSFLLSCVKDEVVDQKKQNEASKQELA